MPPVRYRISADYEQVSVSRPLSSQIEDLFGPATNIAAKINSLANRNGLVIGGGLFSMVKGLQKYVFSPAVANGEYAAYHVEEKERKDIINPFGRRAGH